MGHNVQKSKSKLVCQGLGSFLEAGFGLRDPCGKLGPHEAKTAHVVCNGPES